MTVDAVSIMDQKLIYLHLLDHGGHTQRKILKLLYLDSLHLVKLQLRELCKKGLVEKRDNYYYALDTSIQALAWALEDERSIQPYRLLSDTEALTLVKNLAMNEAREIHKFLDLPLYYSF